MDEIWERAVEAALDGQTDLLATHTLTLDGAVKCFQGRLPPPQLLERFPNLLHLSIANVGVSSLEQFPSLGSLQKLVLSDNRIAGGLEFLVEAGLDLLRDLDLSNNRIQFVEDLAPLAQLKLLSLDLYECPVTRVKDYRSRVLGLIKSLKYLDKTDAEGNERPESDDEEDEKDEDEEEDEDVEEDPGSGEVDAEERTGVHEMSNGHGERLDGVVDVDEDEESNAEEEESEQGRGVNGPSHRPNGFRVQPINGKEGEDSGDNSESGEEIDEEEGENDDDVVEMHEVEDSDNEEDGVDDEENEEEVDNDDVDLGGPESNGRVMNTECEIDGHEQGEDDDDGFGETGEEEQGVEDDGDFGDEDEGEEEEEEVSGEGYLVQPVGQEGHGAAGRVIESIDEDDDPEGEEEVDIEAHALPLSSSSSSSRPKRKRDENDNEAGGDGVGDEEDDDDVIGHSKSSKKHN